MKYQTLPELMKEMPLKAKYYVGKDVKATIDGYLYAEDKWQAMINWNGNWYTEEQLEERFKD